MSSSPDNLVLFTLGVVRYIMVVKVSDSTGEAWFSSFNDEAEKIIGCSADELNKLRSEVRRQPL